MCVCMYNLCSPFIHIPADEVHLSVLILPINKSTLGDTTCNCTCTLYIYTENIFSVTALPCSMKTKVSGQAF